MHRKFLFFVFLLSNCYNLTAQFDPRFTHEVGIMPFAVEWNNETSNEPIAPKSFYRVFYNRHFYIWSWTNSIGYGKNKIKDRSQDCFDCLVGTGRMEELIFTSGVRLRSPTKQTARLNSYLEAGAYFSDYRYSGEFEGGFSGPGVFLDLKSETLGAYGELGLTYSPVPRISFYASTKFKGGKDFFGERKVKTYGLTLIQVGVGFFPFK